MWILLLKVHSCNRYLEHWVYFCRTAHWQTSFPWKNVVHQLDLMTDLLGTPSLEAIARIRNEKARRYLSGMRKKKPIPFTQKFHNADPLALCLLEKMLAFEPKDRPSAKEALADPYFKGLAKFEREPSAQPVTKMEFEFEGRRMTKEDVRELIYSEILEHHPKMLKEYLEGAEPTGFMYPSAVDQFKKQFAYLEEHYKNGSTGAPPERQHASLPRACVLYSDNSVLNPVEVIDDLSKCQMKDVEQPNNAIPMTSLPMQVPQNFQAAPAALARPGKVVGSLLRYYCVEAAAPGGPDQRQMVRNPAMPTHFAASAYPKRNPIYKNGGEDEGVAGSSVLQPKPQYLARNVASAQDGIGNHW